MATINEILQFHFSPSTFQQRAKSIISPTLIKLNEDSVLLLQEIVTKIGPGLPTEPSKNLISTIVRKFKTGFANGSYSLDKRELRTLTYALNYSENGLSAIFNSDQELDAVFRLLEGNWRDAYIYGLFNCYLTNWESRNRNSLLKLSRFVLTKVANAESKRKTIQSIQKNIKYFQPQNGDVVLGTELFLKKIPIEQVTKFLEVPDSWISFSYFSKVILSYFEYKKTEFFEYLYEIDPVLEKHQMSKTSILLISSLIILGHQKGNIEVRNLIKDLAFKYIGDPENKQKWQMTTNVTEEEIREIQNAKIILNEWITQQVIDVFFNICIFDERRRKFWLKHASKIGSFKIYGSFLTKNMLKNDSRISDIIINRFRTINGPGLISAFVFYIKDYMLIAFSDPGYSFYAYKVNGNLKPNLNKLNNINELRNGSLSQLVYKSGRYINHTNEEGRQPYHDGELKWEEVFNYWLKNVLKI